MASAPVSEGNPMEEIIEQIDDSKFFDLTLFWDIAQQSNVNTNHKTKELSLSSLIEILKICQSYKIELKDYFINLAIENIQRGETVYFSIVFFQNLLSTYPHDDQTMGSRQKTRNQVQDTTIESLIGQIFKRIDLHTPIITQAGTYLNSFRSQIE